MRKVQIALQRLNKFDFSIRFVSPQAEKHLNNAAWNRYNKTRNILKPENISKLIEAFVSFCDHLNFFGFKSNENGFLFGTGIFWWMNGRLAGVWMDGPVTGSSA